MIGMLGSAAFLGWSLTTLIIPPISDKYGRRSVYLSSVIVTAVALAIGLYFSRSLYVTIAMMFLAGAATSGRNSVGFIYCCEFLQPH